MSLRLHQGSFQGFLEERAAAVPHKPSPEPAGICILAGQILRSNLKEYLNREQIATSPLAHFTTIEELASDILRPTDTPCNIIQEGVRDRLIESILRAADPNTDEQSLSSFTASDQIRSEQLEALERLATQIPYEEEDLRETLRNELDDFLRWTDATKDTSSAMQSVGALESRFSKSQSLRTMDAFRGIIHLIDGEIDSIGLDRQQSRSHLVTAARGAVATEWTTQFNHVEWISVAGIAVFDNPTLRFLESIAAHDAAPSVEVFVNAGSFEYNATRFEALDAGVVADTQDTTSKQLASPVAKTLFDATQGHATADPDASFIEAPTDQRAVEHVANEVQSLLRDGVDPQDILIVAPDAASYQSLVESAFETVEVPVFVETRHPISDIPAYRCYRTLIEIIECIASEKRIPYGTLVDPLRLGYVEPGAQGSQWPIDGRDFTKIEQELHHQQHYFNQQRDRYEDKGLLIDEWREVIAEIPEFTADWDAVRTYLDTVDDLAGNPPHDGSELRERIRPFLGTYVYQTVDHRRALYKAPAIDTTRTAITETHATSLAERVRSQLDAVGSHYDRMRELFDVEPSWEEVGRALSSVLGSDSYGERHLDGQAIPLVDAGNAYFRNASHLFVLGMNADEFPAPAGTPTFLPASLRQRVYREAFDDTASYPHLDCRATAYGEALDFYQATLSTATSECSISLVHTYRDDQGNDIAWSSFVDLFDVEGEGESAAALVNRVSVGEWLPRPRRTGQYTKESWADVVARTAPRERLRMLLYQAHRSRPDREPAITRADLETIVDSIDSAVLADEILPRIERYHDPPTRVTIDPTEPAFDDVGLPEVAGLPLRPHELDLNGQCGLKYYYYQLLYNYEGSSPERDAIPTYFSRAQHYRLDKLPHIIRENYADQRYVEKWQRIVSDLLPNRQSTTTGVRQFESADALRSWMCEHDVFGEYDMETIYDNLLAELALVEREIANGIDRDWQWRDGGIVDINGSRLKVPPYRLDTLVDGDSEYVVPIFFTRFSNRANSALKHCHTAIWEADETTHTLCLECDNCDSCVFNSKYVLDHRMLAGFENETREYDNNIVGIGLQEQYAGIDKGARVVAMRTGITNKFHPFSADDLFESLRSRGYSETWDEKAATWRENFLSQAARVSTEDPFELEANMDLVERDDCLNCVYRELCMVPSRGGGQ